MSTLAKDSHQFRTIPKTSVAFVLLFLLGSETRSHSLLGQLGTLCCRPAWSGSSFIRIPHAHTQAGATTPRSQEHALQGEKRTLNFTLNHRRLGTITAMPSTKTNWRDHIPEFRTHYKATVVKTVWFLHNTDT